MHNHLTKLTNITSLLRIKNSVETCRSVMICEIIAFRKIFRPKRDVVTVVWRKLHNEELHDLYSLPTIVRVIKSGKMRWVGHVRSSDGKGIGVYRVFSGGDT
jgi:hypothetical protein